MVKRISSGGTFFYKFAIPAVFLVPGALTLVMVALNVPAGGVAPVIFVSAWLVMMVAFTRMHSGSKLKLVSVDETSLHVSNYLKSITVPLNEVTHIEKRDVGARGFSDFVWVIHLRRDTVFGREIMFRPVPDHTLPDRGGAEDLVNKIPAW